MHGVVPYAVITMSGTWTCGNTTRKSGRTLPQQPPLPTIVANDLFRSVKDNVKSPCLSLLGRAIATRLALAALGSLLAHSTARRPPWRRCAEAAVFAGAKTAFKIDTITTTIHSLARHSLPPSVRGGLCLTGAI